jgi:16S rRNA (adenine1518-N6/adenine1519-N6)-dimethyltransferase
LNDSSVDLTDRTVVQRILREADVRPSKRLGQSFLVDSTVLTSIAEIVRDAAPHRIVEIGAGLGTVTRVLAPLARQVVAVELDRRLVGVLERTVGETASVEIRTQDILDFDFVAEGETVFVVGSIPYHLTAPIVRHLVRQRAAISGAALLTQREVAEKIAASPGVGGTAFGVFVRAYADVTSIRAVKRTSFYPPPDVESTLSKLSFLDAPRFQAAPDTFFSVVRAVYGARRKMIRKALRAILPSVDIARVLCEAGIEGSARGETFAFDELDRLARAIERRGTPTSVRSR